MNQNIRDKIDKALIFLRLRGIVTAFRSLYQLEYGIGHFLSSTFYQSIDKEKNPIPWFTYPIIDYLNNLNLKNKTIFEYGSGNSTIYWATRCKSLVAVEHDEIWFSVVKEKIEKYNNSKLLFVNSASAEKYSSSILKFDTKFDIIVIDGEHREKCARKAIKKLKSGGMIILDNSDWFPKIKYFLEKQGFNRIDFKGFAPINPYLSTTSIFFKLFNFKIK